MIILMEGEMMEGAGDQGKLEIWQERLKRNEAAYSSELVKMESREKIYGGSDLLTKLVPGDAAEYTRHVRNIASELIESQVNGNIPQPKVTPKRPADAAKAKLIEDLIRGELDRLPMEVINDMAERTVPIQGGTVFLVEWDSSKHTHATSGEINITMLHPRQVIPQEGVYSGVQDMDYIIFKVVQTRENISRKYGVKLKNDDGIDDNSSFESHGEDVIVQNIAYYRNETGGIGIFSWAGETILEDMQDCQAQRKRQCSRCQEAVPDRNVKQCPKCGKGKLEEIILDSEEIMQLSSATVTVPVYNPSIFPVVTQKNVSVYGKFLGDSDIDKIKDQQNTANRIEQKIIDKLLKSGSYLVLPEQADIQVDAQDMKIIRPETPAAAGQIGVKDLQGNISQDILYLEQVYQEARQITGITESFQGRVDTTATSGRAKEFSAAQAAGRLESKNIMKNAAYAELFEIMFKFALAYMDEPRPVASQDSQGNPEYKTFNRYDFLERDSTGELYWNDGFQFSCDSTASLSGNREAMWQETRQNFESGTFGDPSQRETLILFWKKMEMLQYPGASETRANLEGRVMGQSEQLNLEQINLMQAMV